MVYDKYSILTVYDTYNWETPRCGNAWKICTDFMMFMRLK